MYISLAVFGWLALNIYKVRFSYLVVLSRFGTRRVCLAGTVTAGLGLLLASFAWDLPSLYLTYRYSCTPASPGTCPPSSTKSNTPPRQFHLGSGLQVLLLASFS
jgi:hypothetical protein